jgi:thymidylate kinase
VTLTGADGMGKTRLAAEIARELHGAGASVLYAAGTGSSRYELGGTQTATLLARTRPRAVTRRAAAPLPPATRTVKR